MGGRDIVQLTIKYCTKLGLLLQNNTKWTLLDSSQYKTAVGTISHRHHHNQRWGSVCLPLSPSYPAPVVIEDN